MSFDESRETCFYILRMSWKIKRRVNDETLVWQVVGNFSCS